MNAAKKEADDNLWIWGEIALLSMILSQIAVIASWHAILAAPETSWWADAAILTLILLGSHFPARLANNTALSLPRKRSLFGVWMAVCIIVSLKWMYFANSGASIWAIAISPIQALLTPGQALGKVWHTLIVLLAAYQGIRLAKAPLTHYDAIHSFQIGLAGLLIFGFFYAARIDRTETAGWMFFELYGFFFFGLLALITSRISRLSDLRGGRLPRFGRGWALGTLLSALIVVGAAVIAGWVFGNQVGSILIAVYILLLALVSAAVLLVISPIIVGLVTVLSQFKGAMGGTISQIQVGKVQQFADQALDYANQVSVQNSISISQAGRVTLVVVLLVIVLGIIYFGLRWEPVRNRLLGEAETDPAEKNPDKLKNEDGAGQPKRGLFKARQILAAAQIRRIYAQMLDLAEKLGTPRPKAQTPLEFLPKLQALFPEDAVSVGEITHAYLRIRYGELPEQEEEIEKVQAAWRSVNAHGRKKQKALAAVSKHL
jgi:hypothetical protein